MNLFGGYVETLDRTPEPEPESIEVENVRE